MPAFTGVAWFLHDLAVAPVIINTGIEALLPFRLKWRFAINAHGEENFAGERPSAFAGALLEGNEAGNTR